MAEKNESHLNFKRTILITGSTDGIGRQTALELAVRNKENFVIVHGRNIEKCKATIDYIMREGKLSDKSNLDFVVADFSDLKEVSDLATDVEKRFPRLNVLLCNAGVLLPKRAESRNGLELTFQINHLAHFLIINRLLALLKENQPSRVIIVSSSLHSWHKIDWRDLMAEREYEKYLQFSRTKLMNHLTSFALHRLLVRQGCQFRVTSNVIDLGSMEPRDRRSRSTSLSSSDTTLVLSSGVGTLLTLVESPALENVSGKYFDCHGKQTRSGSDATDERLQQKLWEMSEQLCKDYLNSGPSISSNYAINDVNYLAHYILSRSLFTLLKNNAPSRLVLVSSICYEWYSLDWSDLESLKTYEKYTQYSRTKLMIHLMTFKLARLFNKSGVTCNVLEPGVIETKLLRAGGYSGAPVCEGSRACIFLCTSDSVINVNGAYYDKNCKRVTKLFKDAVDEKQQEDLWQLTDKLCEEKGVILPKI
ncbi:short chain dehydrogenase family protein [Acanthocheilonema viteae]